MCCGSNNKGQLGLGDTNDRNVFTKINIELKNSLPIIDNNYKVVLGDTSYILKNNNTLWGSGNNEVGQLGLDDIANRNVFTRMTIENIRDIACGDNYIIVLKNDDTIWGTGNNNYGQLGLDSTGNVTSFNQLNVNVEKIICGKVHTFIMKKDKTIWGTGNNDYGQLGLGDTINKNVFTKVDIDNVEKIICGYYHTFIIKNDGILYSCGYNVYGQLGLGDTINKNVFTKVDIDNVKKIGCGVYHTFILKEDGALYSCGHNVQGQLGLGDTTQRNTFTKIDIDNVKDIICGHYHTFIIKNDNTVWACGLNNYGQLGLGDTTQRNTFTKIDIDNVKDIICGLDYTFILKNDGSIWACGNNNKGKLGLGDTNARLLFTKIEGHYPYRFDTLNNYTLNNNFNLINNTYIIPSRSDINYKNILGSIYKEKYDINNDRIELQENIKEFWMSKTHSLLINTKGELFGCGDNTYGQLLNPRTTSSLSNFTKLDFADIRQASCGVGFSYFLKNDYTLYSAGLNSEYQLGLGHNNEVNGLQRVNISNVKKVMCDDKFTLVLLNDNSVWGQGLNRFGNFGLGEASANTIIKTFTKLDVDMEDVEIGGDYISFRKLDKSLWICSKIRDCYNMNSNNPYIFNKIQIPEEFNNDLLWLDAGRDETLFMNYQAPTTKPSIELAEKTIAGIKLKVNDSNNEIDKIEMYLNNELIHSKNEFINNFVLFTIPLEKLNLGINNIYFKANTLFGDNMYLGATINKENNSINISEGANLFIKNKKYNINSLTNSADCKLVITLDRALEDNISVGDIIYQLINQLKVQVKTNNTGMHKDMNLLEMKKVDTGYQEIYELEEKGMTQAEPKIIVEKGDNWTAIKRPSMIFSIDETTL
nr:RCC1 domain-containing protein [Clostridioides difficile]